MWSVALFAAGFLLFVTGMRVMVNGLKRISSRKVHELLSRATGRPVAGIIAGTVVTVLVQSSGLVTSMTVGLVESGACSLIQGIYITMGANLGTTVVPQFLAIRLPPLEFAILGLSFIMWVFQHKKRAVCLAGIGLLMLGMRLMVAGASPLAQTASFRFFLRMAAKSPLAAILCGAATSAALQSSGLVVAMVLALAKAGAVPPVTAVCVAIGSNVGTCVTALMAGIGTGRSARLVALFHLVYNAAGVALLFPFVLPFVRVLSSLAPDLGRQVAHAHSFFNAASILLFWPVVAVLSRGRARTRGFLPGN